MPVDKHIYITHCFPLSVAILPQPPPPRPWPWKLLLSSSSITPTFMSLRYPPCLLFRSITAPSSSLLLSLLEKNKSICFSDIFRTRLFELIVCTGDGLLLSRNWRQWRTCLCGWQGIALCLLILQVYCSLFCYVWAWIVWRSSPCFLLKNLQRCMYSLFLSVSSII